MLMWSGTLGEGGGMTLEGVARTRLSQRENAVMDLAILGMTDQQIAQKLLIALSTVSSYWVRIRGKVGHFSRTELVAAILKSEAGDRIARIQRESDDFERRATARESDLLDGSFSEILRAGLDALPEAHFIAAEDGTILHTNVRMDSLFGYPPGELHGKDFTSLFGSRLDTCLQDLLQKLSSSRDFTMGIDAVLYGNRRNGLPLRMILLVGRNATSQGTVVTGVVRTFIDEVDLRRRNLTSIARLF